MITIVSFFTNNGEPALGLNPLISIRDIDTGNVIVAEGSGDVMEEVGDGWYKYSFEADDDKDYIIRCNGGDTLTTADRYTFAGTETKSYTLTIEDKLTRALCLAQENYRIFNPRYDRNHNLVSATIKIYSSAADVDTDTNPIATYSITASHNNKNEMTGYKVKKN